MGAGKARPDRRPKRHPQCRRLSCPSTGKARTRLRRPQRRPSRSGASTGRSRRPLAVPRLPRIPRPCASAPSCLRQDTTSHGPDASALAWTDHASAAAGPREEWQRGRVCRVGDDAALDGCAFAKRRPDPEISRVLRAFRWSGSARPATPSLDPARSPRPGACTTNAPRAPRHREYSRARTRRCRPAPGASQPRNQCAAYRNSRTGSRSVKDCPKLSDATGCEPALRGRSDA